MYTQMMAMSLPEVEAVCRTLPPDQANMLRALRGLPPA